MKEWIFHQFYNFNFLMIGTLIGYHRLNKKRWQKKNGNQSDF